MTGIELTPLDAILSKTQVAEIQAGKQGVSNEVSASAAKFKEDIFGSSMDPWLPEKLMAGFVALEALVEAVILLNGRGEPNKGEEFHKGNKNFSGQIASILHSATPVQWSGTAAEKYLSQHLRQQSAVNAVADTDRRVTRILTEQSSWVKKTREDLASARETAISGLVLGGTYYALCKVYRGLPLEHVIVLQMFLALILIALLVFLETLMALVALGDYVTHSHRELLEVANDYQSVTDSAAEVTATAGLPAARMALAGQSAAADFVDAFDTHSGLLGESGLARVISGSLSEKLLASASISTVTAAPPALGGPGHAPRYSNRDGRNGLPAGSSVAQERHVPAAGITGDDADDGTALTANVTHQILVEEQSSSSRQLRPTAHFV
ncbi:MAG: hypothetical protein K2Q25_05500 [Mycobacteriaceae bacterium]|nr:hypothetical protein [Mycobacteriaceae bacterium]